MFQRLKRAKDGNVEEEKLFMQAEKNVTEERKKREGAQKGTTKGGNDRFHFSKKPGKPMILFCFVRLRCWFAFDMVSLFVVGKYYF